MFSMGSIHRHWLVVVGVFAGLAIVSARLEDHPKLNRAKNEANMVPNSYIVLTSQTEEFTSLEDLVEKDYIKYEYKVALKGYALHKIPDEDMLKVLNDDRVKGAYETESFKRPDVITEETQFTQPMATWGIDRIDSRTGLDTFYNYDFTGAGVRIYVMDEGVRGTHEEFTIPTDRFDGCADFASGQTNACAFPGDHGTHVAGTAMGTTYGVAKEAHVYDVHVLNSNTGSGSFDDVIAGANFVAAQQMMNPDADYVMNASLGGGQNDAVDMAFAGVRATGVVVVVAAGNDDSDACFSSPAAELSIVTVGSTDNTDARSGFSNFGDCVQIFAPGSSITSAYAGSDTEIATISGTSMASPHVAGIAALLFEEGVTDVQTELINMATPDVISDPMGTVNLFAFNGFAVAGPTTPHPTNPPTPAPTPAPVPTIGCPSGQNLALVDIETDDYASETTWQLVNDCDGTTIDTGGDSYVDFTRYIEQNCVDDSQQYTWTIFDSFGDGICCGFGLGSFDVYYDGNLVGSGGQFAFSDSVTFGTCPGAPTPTAPAPTPTAPAPTPTATAPTPTAPTAPPTPCFSKEATVTVKDQGPTKMSQLELGNEILTAHGYQPIYAFAHNNDDATPAEFVRIHTRGDKKSKQARNPLEISGEHMVYMQGKENPVRADSIVTGDVLMDITSSSGGAVVTRIDNIPRYGLYAPITAGGTLVVDGITASCYVSLQENAPEYVTFQNGRHLMSQHYFVHTTLAPARMLCIGVSPKLCDMYNSEGTAHFVAWSMSLAHWVNAQNLCVQMLVAVVWFLLIGPLFALERMLGPKLCVWVVFSAALMASLSLRSLWKKTASGESKKKVD